MSSFRANLVLAFAATLAVLAAEPTLPGVGAAMQEMIARNEIAGAVTAVVTKDRVLHLETHGFADVAAKRPMTVDTVFWIASMTKPVTGAAILMLQDEGKLTVGDPVARYLPEFAGLKTPSGKLANLTIAQVLTHTSGLGEAGGPAAQRARTLADLVPLWLAAPMQYEPGERWRYTQSGINAAARIVEVVSGMTFDAFVQKRIFDPLAMKDTTFYPTNEQRARLATAYARSTATGALEPVPPRPEFGAKDRPPQGNGGLYSTAPDYARFCQMLLNGGTLDGRRFLSARAMTFLATPQTGDLPTGFFQNDTYGNRGANYGWGIGTSIVRAPHDGVAAMLSPGTYGHGGAWGTQAWVDPVKGVAYVLMVQRSNFPNSDASDVRRAFQQAAADAIAKTNPPPPAPRPAAGAPFDALERLFPVDPDRRAILGLSRSTVGALDLCANSAVAFESCALLAPAIARKDFAAVLPAKGGRSRVLIEAGRYDVPLITAARALRQERERRAVRVHVVESPQGHNHTAFRASLPRLLAALFPPARPGRRD